VLVYQLSSIFIFQDILVQSKWRKKSRCGDWCTANVRLIMRPS